jgi:Uma2 family endonuclease
MTALRKPLMSVDEFMAWADRQPETWELFDGVPMAMSPERVIHGETKYRVARALEEAIARSGAPCRFVLDSAAVPIDSKSSYQPDVMVYCGPPVSGDSLAIPNPVIVFEVLSPSNAIKDLRDKLQGYFKVASVQHYLIVDPDTRIIIHHARGHDDAVLTRIVRDGDISLAPPGLLLASSDLFPQNAG